MKSRVHPTYKTHYRAGNWRVYGRALAGRGDVTLCGSPQTPGQRGEFRRPVDRAGSSGSRIWRSMGTALPLRLVFRLPLRQTEGFVRSILTVMRAGLGAPDHTTLSRLGQSLDVAVHNLSANGPLHLIVDSTGFQWLAKGSGPPRNMADVARVREAGRRSTWVSTAPA